MNDRFAEIVPVQLRGMGARSLTQEERRAVPVRIRTRGRLERSLDLRDPRPLADLVAGLRRDVDGLPLTALVIWRGAGDRQLAFVKQLVRALNDPLDAVWIAAVNDPAAARACIGGAPVVLDLAKDSDHAICANLVVDLLFAACDDQGDTTLLAQFTRRTPFVIIPEGANELGPYGIAAASAGIPVLEWQEKNASVTAPLPIAFLPEVTCENDANGLAVAKELAQIATQLTPRSDRRIRFRSALKRIAPTPEREPLVTSLLGHAHEARWPGWAVETLPCRYLPTGMEDGRVLAWMWSLFPRCVAAEIPVLDRLCGGTLLVASVDERTSEILLALDRKIEEHVCQIPASGDGAFFNGVAAALEFFAASVDVPQHAGRMRDLSGRLASRRE